MKRLTKEELKAEKEARDAFFAKASQQPTHQDNQTDKLVDRGLVKWWA